MEDTRNHRVRLEYCDNLTGWWLYVNGYLIEHFPDYKPFSECQDEFIKLSLKYNGKANEAIYVYNGNDYHYYELMEMLYKNYSCTNYSTFSNFLDVLIQFGKITVKFI